MRKMITQTWNVNLTLNIFCNSWLRQVSATYQTPTTPTLIRNSRNPGWNGSQAEWVSERSSMFLHCFYHYSTNITADNTSQSWVMYFHLNKLLQQISYVLSASIYTVSITVRKETFIVYLLHHNLFSSLILS